ncbi:MAG: ATP phosphoribosyltransferase regulatory subunit, partial [Chloroflexales bacterium]|nr:ATP phosphoribosyltransferase regulatory subunit [Chloroflexales bacterium]
DLADDERASAALGNLRAIINALADMGIPAERYSIAPRLARGLSYYTGTVFEAITAHWPEGSLLGGGRYDELIGLFAGRPIPTVGLAFGIDRLHDVMEELGLGPRLQTTAQVFVTIFGAEQAAASLQLARELRSAGLNVVISLDPGTSLGKQFKEADRKGVRYALVLGPDELARGEVVVKELATGAQRSVPRAAVAAVLR